MTNAASLLNRSSQNSNNTLKTTATTLFHTAITSLITTKDKDDDGLTEEEKRKQKLFGILVITCFFTLLFSIIGYVSFVHFKKIRLAEKQRRQLEEELKNPDKPIIQRRTSVMGQGQKQVVIERKASVSSANNRKHSLGSQGSYSRPLSASKLLRQQSSWISPPSSPPPPLDKQNFTGDVFFPNSPVPYVFNPPYPAPYYLDNVLVRYRNDSDYKAGTEEPMNHVNEDGGSGQSSCVNVCKLKNNLRKEGRVNHREAGERGIEFREEEEEEEDDDDNDDGNEDEVNSEGENKEQIKERGENDFYLTHSNNINENDEKRSSQYDNSHGVRETNESSFLLNTP